jgi:hypothetical protein
VLINPSVAAAAEPAISLSLTFAGCLNKATAIEATAKQVGCCDLPVLLSMLARTVAWQQCCRWSGLFSVFENVINISC